MQKLFLFILSFGIFSCKAPSEAHFSAEGVLPVQVSTTTGNGSLLLHSENIAFAKGKNEALPVLQIDTKTNFQSIDGFGYTLTGGSAYLLHQMNTTARAALLNDFFGKSADAIGVRYLRISIGASDLDETVFSYDDLPDGQTDPDLKHFSLSKDTQYLIPVLKEIVGLQPKIKIMGTPWSPPVWMKTNRNSMGGNLLPEFYGTYARYLVQYIKAMQSLGIAIDAITPQNEPQHGGNNPSMVMSAAQQANFIKNHLGPAFRAAGIATKIIVWDHNCDQPDFPLEILNDPAAKQFVDGSAFHLYAGEVDALSKVHDAHADKHLYFTEQWTGSEGEFAGDLMWHTKNVIIGVMRNWGRIALEWNLANDPQFGPHTPGGCTQCRGAVTIHGDKSAKNVSYYIIAQASKFVTPGSVRVESTWLDQLPNVAFRTPEGKTVLIVLNESAASSSFNIHDGEKWIKPSLPATSVSTFVW